LYSFDAGAFQPKQLIARPCTCGSPFQLESCVVYGKATVYGLLGPKEISVPQFQCADVYCPHILHFDGMYHGFLRTGAQTFMDIDLVNLIRGSLIVGATPLSATYRTIEGLYYSHAAEFCSRSTFVTSCWAILKA
jgi:hypothetical protein